LICNAYADGKANVLWLNQMPSVAWRLQLNPIKGADATVARSLRKEVNRKVGEGFANLRKEEELCGPLRVFVSALCG